MTAAVALATVLSLAGIGAPAAPPPASAAVHVHTAAGPVKALTASNWTPGNIISDALFYDGAAMTAAQIQSFLDAKIGRCTNGQCLNVLSQTVASRPEVDSRIGTHAVICSAISGGTFTAAQIIYKAQAACGLSARVILVTLQKEQGLVTSSAPSIGALNAAMGMNCPDTSACSDVTKGFALQVFAGALQLVTYRANQVGKQPGPQQILFNPRQSPPPGCGSALVNIVNYATAALYTYTPYQPDAAALADLSGSGDGCSSFGNRNFWVYYNNWFGSTLGPAPSTAGNTSVGEPKSYVLARDFSGVLWMIPSDQHGGWAPPVAEGSNWNYMTTLFNAGDFDGDGAADVVAGDSLGYLYDYPRDGSGGWKTHYVIGTGWNVFSKVFPVGDINGDGNPDIVAWDPAGNLWLYPGNGHGDWNLPRRQIGSGWNIYNAVFDAGDFDGDGHRDLIARDGAGNLWLYSGDGHAGWAPRRQIGSGWGQFTSVQSGGDLTGDGHPDVLAIDAAGNAWIYPGDGHGGFLPAINSGGGWGQYTVISSVGVTTRPPATGPGLGDFNGDGQADVLARDAGGNLYLYPTDGAGGWHPRSQIGTGWQVFTSVIGSADINGDQHPDIIVRSAAGTLSYYPGTGTGAVAAPVPIAGSWGAYNTLFSPGDFNGDGHPDLIGRDGAGVLWLMAGDGNGGFAAPVRIGAGWQIFTSIVGAGDFDGDGTRDLFARDAAGNLWLYRGNGSGGFGTYNIIGRGWQIFDQLIGSGDVTHDGHPDLLAREPDGNLWLYPGNGHGGWGSYRVIGTGWQVFTTIQ